MSRAVVCRCEDVTAPDVERAFRLGHRHIEEVKRYTGFGTGPCEGKECLAAVARLVAKLDEGGAATPFTARSPIAPVSLAALAGAGDLAALPPSPPALEPEVRGAPPSEPLPAKAEIVVIGAGIMGLAIAYELARGGARDVVVLDKGFVNYGASGRNGGGIRLQWSTETNVRLMQESMRICRRFVADMGVNVWMRRGGYLILARTPDERAALEASVALQNRCGVPTRLLSPADTRGVVPDLAVEGVVAASFNPDDAVVFPWPFLWGYAQRARRLGVRIHMFTPVTGLRRDGAGLCAVGTTRGTISTRRVVAACGAWTPTIGRMLGVDVPSWPHRHEILSTEPLKPWLAPMVAEIGSGLYFSQSMRGEIVGGLALPDGEDTPRGARRVNLAARLVFLREFARALLRAVPRLAEVKVLRQWAGPYDMTPDGHPLVGEHPACPGLWLASGFVGHGFMMAPAVARHAAAALTGRARHGLFDEWGAGRFANGGRPAPETLHIG